MLVLSVLHLHLHLQLSRLPVLETRQQQAQVQAQAQEAGLSLVDQALEPVGVVEVVYKVEAVLEEEVHEVEVEVGEHDEEDQGGKDQDKMQAKTILSKNPIPRKSWHI